MDSQQALTRCTLLFEQMAQSCCMPQGSELMRSVLSELKVLYDSSCAGQAEPYETMGRLTQIGSQIGEMYVSCCTQQREPKYQEALSLLSQVYRTQMQASGMTH